MDDKKPPNVEEVEIEALSDEDLETIAGGGSDVASGCCSNFAASCAGSCGCSLDQS